MRAAGHHLKDHPGRSPLDQRAGRGDKLDYNIGEKKKRLDQAKGIWEDDILRLLWSYHMMSRSLTGETPFMLAFGTEAVIPV